METKSRC